MQVFARFFGFGGSLVTGALTLSLLVLPIIIVSTREAIKAVPSSIKDASYAMGATKWQTIWYQVLPASFGSIITGVILAMSRAIGEAAPLIVVGALAYISFIPASPMDEFSVLPIQIFHWISRPQQGFVVVAAAAIIILLAITFLLNLIAIYLRNKFQNKYN
ncbi:MAG: ABC transporter permease subunit [Flavobacteriaceae bacterium]|nr:ABC transporter permease subunit [Flavobacteriaceae bacterium]